MDDLRNKNTHSELEASISSGETPIYGLNQLDSSKENVVLFSFGSYGPVHYGHVRFVDRSINQD